MTLKFDPPICRKVGVGSPQPANTSDPAAVRAHLESLVAEAERLVGVAREEANRIVARAREETTHKVQRLIAEADRLRSSAEHEVDEVRQEAEEIRRAARAEADIVLARARSVHDEIVRRARQVDSAPPPGPQSRSAVEAGTGPSPVDEARTEADRILRVARAEAEARAAEIMEEARRKAENIEADGRRRVDGMRATYRGLQRRMREEETAVLDRIAAYEERLATLKERLESEARHESRPEPESPVSPALDSGATEESETPAPTAVRRQAELIRSIRAEMAEKTDDPEILKALRAFRRRT